MSLIAKEKGGTKELIPEGMHLARCISIIDLGTQKITFEKKEKEVHQVRFEFELPNLKYKYEDKETKEEIETTKVSGKNFTISLHAKSTMRKFLEGWRGRKFTKEELEGFDLSKIIGKTCQLQIIHSEDGQYANIENALPLMGGIEVPKTDRDLITFSILEDEKGKVVGYDEEIYGKLPEWLQEKIMESVEMKKLYGIVDLDEQEKELEKEVAEKKVTKTEEVENNVAKAKIKSEQKAEVKEEIKTEEVEGIFDGKAKEDDDFE